MCETKAMAYHMLWGPPSTNNNLSHRGGLTSFWHLFHANHLCPCVPVSTFLSHPSSLHSSRDLPPPPLCSLPQKPPHRPFSAVSLQSSPRHDEQRINNKTAVKIKGKDADLLCKRDENSNFTWLPQQSEGFGVWKDSPTGTNAPVWQVHGLASSARVDLPLSSWNKQDFAHYHFRNQHHELPWWMSRGPIRGAGASASGGGSFLLPLQMRWCL